MSLPDELKPIFDRIAQHQQTDADMAVLRQYWSSGGQLGSQQGMYIVNLEHGQDIHVGDRIYQDADAETIRNIVRAMLQKLQAKPNAGAVTEPASSTTNTSSGKQQRLEQRRETLQADWNLRNKKIKQLRAALAIEAGKLVQFQLENELAEEEAQLARLTEELERIELTQEAHSFVQDDCRPQKQEYGNPVGLGLAALAELMQHPEAKSAVITFQKDFEAACKQINVVANYKELHDQLHKLEFQCYIPILQSSKRFLDDEITIGDLEDYSLTLQDILKDVQDIAGRGTIVINEIVWLKNLERAQKELHAAIEETNPERLKETIRLLNHVLATQLSRINTKLNTAAQALRLPELVSAMNAVWQRLAESSLNQEKVQQFQKGVKALADLNERLALLIIGHDRWQELDSELRWIENNLIELETFWFDLKKRVEILFDPAGEQWIVSFRRAGQDLDKALNTQNPVKIKSCFRTYRQRASKRFDEVDGRLKCQCQELREIGKPLAFVLEMIA